ncbi:MAG: excalibur calcium-binding domain-containing protein [Sulfurimonas sp.]|jgi:hypothetical protein|uniref:excalibur calcium-binding domain-containing protein n=1 Tax=Sulfurimonas sp. TaxID=2022749 RepID=UPI0026139B4E|nr:excalibur calcium-binding domain-containing protein [Sulfurimonas sp.]MDD3475821.1 excalibur calcium-binding domain-containing protein [Sulfurimonas sp.]
MKNVILLLVVFVISLSASGSNYKCDGRKYCSQMTSCEEAKFFLKNCPDTKMDGDKNGNGKGNGIPCEKQWCGKK